MNNKIIKILCNWGLQNCDIKQIYDTAWQVREHYVLKVYQHLGMLERNLKILRILEEMNIPVGAIVTTHRNKQYVSDDNHFYFLSKKLSGSNIIRIGNVKDIAIMMGEIIANLHIVFKKCEEIDVFWNNSLLDEMNGWVKNNFEQNKWKYIGSEEYEKAVSNLECLYGELPVQLIHRDIHFGNFLFANGEFSGYIDFDLSQKNIRIFEICYFLLSLLSEKEKFEITEEQWFDFLKEVFIGYQHKIPLSETEKSAVPYVMECIELLFVSYYDSIDDVQCAENAYKIFEFVKTQENRIWKNMK